MNVYRVRFHDAEVTNSVRIHADSFYTIANESVEFILDGVVVARFQLSRCDFWREMPGEPRHTQPTLAWEPTYEEDEEFEE